MNSLTGTSSGPMGFGGMAQRDLKKVRTARRRRDKAQESLHAAIVAAHRSGESIRDIAPHAGLGTTRIHQILREASRD